MKATKTILMIATIIIVAGPALADWLPGDGDKMHFPQLPDPNGWDVNGTNPITLADDWVCSETGSVTDVHLWGSWQRDNPGDIASIHVSVHDNIPPDAAIPYSRPADPPVWERDFLPSEFSIQPYGTGQQGWMEPGSGTDTQNDHTTFHQINIMGIDDPFQQKFGTVYWLDISVTLTATSDANSQWGWKTADLYSYPPPATGQHFMDDAVYKLTDTSNWQPLTYPGTTDSLDLAFVITPEPATLAMLGLGGVLTLLRRRRR